MDVALATSSVSGSLKPGSTRSTSSGGPWRSNRTAVALSGGSGVAVDPVDSMTPSRFPILHYTEGVVALEECVVVVDPVLHRGRGCVRGVRGGGRSCITQRAWLR